MTTSTTVHVHWAQLRPEHLAEVVQLETLRAQLAAWDGPLRQVRDSVRVVDSLGLDLAPAVVRDMDRARELVACRRRALVLARGRDVLAVEVARLLRSELAAAHDLTAASMARALDGDAEALADWRDMLDEPDLAALAAEVLDLAERIASTVHAVEVLAEVVAELLAADVVAGAVAILAAEVDDSPPRMALAGSVETTAPPMRHAGAPAANGLRDAMRTRGAAPPT